MSSLQRGVYRARVNRKGPGASYSSAGQGRWGASARFPWPKETEWCGLQEDKLN